MKYLVAGFGSIGRRHFRNLVALGESDIVIYHTGHSTLAVDELAGFPVETDLREALAHQPGAAIISNPTALHLDVAIPAAQAGCHLLLEKPISHSLSRLDELEDATRQNHCQVLAGFQFRFHPGLLQVKRLLDEGAIGNPVSARAVWGEFLPNWHPWEDYRQGYAARPDLGGGVVLTLSHPLDYLRWIFGEVDTLTAFTSHRGLDLPVEDTAEISLRFQSGVLGSIHLDYLQNPACHTLEIIGTRGSLVWDNSNGITRLATVSGANQAVSVQEFYPPEGFERNTMFMDELRHFQDVVQGKSLPACTLEDGKMALRLALAALQEEVVHFD